ncbi:GNAT family N-acetyltransferase [Pseudomonas phage Nerthus]|uniref:GNAT family N-acetyltransferase n=1 Tax=Pseudomonas phage Nerthus TaxID=2163984 RepID=A0A2S1GMM9_9CAUD|nr:GNAT family N-acetyltransferase [Pseudomonas phage Nerthus]AWD90636.1 GNAT family N-acetyltransferase [Pseudomonas phage Nerthus]
MASIITQCKDQTAFYYALNHARRTNKNGASLTSAEDVTIDIANAFRQYWAARPNTDHKVAQAMFYKDHCKLYLAKDGNKVTGGFIVIDGELRSLFTNVKGIGSWLLFWAIREGAKRLDCFDGYLVEFYKRHGFKETKRVENWAHGGPQVVYMEIQA